MRLGKFGILVLMTACGVANQPYLTRVEPSQLWLDELPRDVVVWGQNLEPSIAVNVDRAETVKVSAINARLDDVVVALASRPSEYLTLTVPREIGPGRHNLSVSVGPGRRAFLSDAVEVLLSRAEDTTSATTTSVPAAESPPTYIDTTSGDNASQDASVELFSTASSSDDTVSEPPILDASLSDPLDGHLTDTEVQDAAGSSQLLADIGAPQDAAGSSQLLADIGAPTSETTGESPQCEWGPFSIPERIGGLQGNGTLWGSSVSADPSLMVFAMNDSTDEQIAYATRVGRVATFNGVTLIQGVNSNATEGSPFLSADGQTLYFFSTRSENAPTDSAGERDIWRAIRTGSEFTFANAEALTELNTRNTDQMPWLSDDELTIVFTSDRPSGRGAHDLWQAHRESTNNPFGAPTNFSELNTILNEEGASLSTDLLTIFFVSGTSADSSDFDIYTATRTNAQSTFGAATKVTELNSNSQELYAALSHDGRELFFASNRSGSSELWRGTRDCD